MRRILQVLGAMDVGGAETMIMNIYRKIDRNKVQFDFLVNKEGYYDDEIKSLGGRIIVIESPKKIGIVKYIKEFNSMIKKNEKFDVIHSHIHLLSGFILSLAKIKGIKTRIAHSHTSNDGGGSGLNRKLYRFLMKYLIERNANIKFTCSNEATEDLYIKKENIYFINNAIDFDLYKEKMLDLRKELDLDYEAVLIGHVGSFKKVKNHEFIIDLFSNLNKKIDNVHLILVGDGELKSQIKLKAQNMNLQDKVHFLGIREDIPQILLNLDLFIFPSIYEGLPLAVVEAQLANLTCVLSENITKDLVIQENSVFYEKLQIDKWEKKIHAIFEDHNKTKKRTWNNNKENFDIKNTVRKVEKIYLG